MKILKSLIILSVFAGSGPAFAAEPRCNVMQFFDAKGALMPTPSPIIGMMVGDKPVYDASMPGASAAKPGAETACPPSLVDGVRSTFENACMSDARRRQAAADHKVDSKTIDKGCSDMMKALGSAVAAPK